MSDPAPHQNNAEASGDGHAAGAVRAAGSEPSGGLSEKSPVMELLGIAGPAVITMVSYTIMQSVDMIVVSELGAGAVAAVGNGGIAAFVASSVLFGVLGLINTYTSQNLGAGKPRAGAAYAWNGMWMVLAYWALILLPFAYFMPQAFDGMRRLFGVEADPAVTGMAVEYGRIAIYGMALMLAARALAHFFYGVQRAKWVMISALIANGVNIPLTYALVLGWWGLPAMGVGGAALGTVIGSAIELVILLVIFLGPKFNEAFGTRVAWRCSWMHWKDIMRLGWPAGLMFGNELFCWFVFMSTLVAHFGTAHNDAGWITLRFMHIAFMPAVGLSMAVTAVVGRVVGAGRLDLATHRMKLGLIMSMIYMGLCALAMVLFREQLIWFFAHRMAEANPELLPYVDEVIRIGGGMLIVAAAFQLFDAMAITLVGALRGAGDTIWPGVVTAILSWVWIIGGGYLAIELFPQWGSLGPWSGAAMFIITLALALAWRWKSGAWKRIKVVRNGETGSESRLEPTDRFEPDAPMEEAGMTPDGLAGLLASPDRWNRGNRGDRGDRG